MLTKAFQNHGANLKRWLGLLLVVFISYSTTVEAAHRHGNIQPASNQATAFAHPDSGSGIFKTKPGCNDCLLCQLHQNFSATAISIKLTAEPLTRRTPANSLVPVLVSSITHTAQSGRAPPQAN
jgi:hypothetical protein